MGQIFPVESKLLSGEAIHKYFLQPLEMVWILSKEEFAMPSTATGLAALRTSFTKDGVLALNVGIIDPLFHGPISTALINFSDRPRRIDVGDKFFESHFFNTATCPNFTHPTKTSRETHT